MFGQDFVAVSLEDGEMYTRSGRVLQRGDLLEVQVELTKHYESPDATLSVMTSPPSVELKGATPQ